MPPASADSKPMYQKDEKALCFHGELLYEAKVLEVDKVDPSDKNSPWRYRVHYKGWKNTYVNPFGSSRPLDESPFLHLTSSLLKSQMSIIDCACCLLVILWITCGCLAEFIVVNKAIERESCRLLLSGHPRLGPSLNSCHLHVPEERHLYTAALYVSLGHCQHFRRTLSMSCLHIC
jgi:hypothetical protein